MCAGVAHTTTHTTTRPSVRFGCGGLEAHSADHKHLANERGPTNRRRRGRQALHLFVSHPHVSRRLIESRDHPGQDAVQRSDRRSHHPQIE